MPELEALGRVPYSGNRDAEAEDDVDDPGRVEALCLVTDSAEHHLHKHEDEDGEARLGVRTIKVGARPDFDNDEDHGDKDNQEGSNLDVAMHREPREEGATETADEDGGRNEDEPSNDHQHHVCDDQVVTPVQDAVGLAEVASVRCWRNGSVASAVTAGRRG